MMKAASLVAMEPTIAIERQPLKASEISALQLFLIQLLLIQKIDLLCTNESNFLFLLYLPFR